MALLAADGATDSIQPLLEVAIRHGLAPSFDKNRVPVHNVVIGPTRQTDCPIRLPEYIAKIRHELTSRGSPNTELSRPSDPGRHARVARPIESELIVTMTNTIGGLT